MGSLRQHNLYLDSQHTLSEMHMSDSSINVVTTGLSRVNHESISELHTLGSLSSQFTRDNHFTSLSTGLHNKTKHTIASPSNSKTSDQLVTEGFGLSNRTETSLGNLFGIELN